MYMYSIVNVEKMKLYEPPMIMDQGENVQVPSIDDVEYLHVVLKGMHPIKA